MIDKEDGQKSHHGAGDRVKQVLEAGRDRLPRPLVKDQRHGHEGEKLETQVHRDKVSREALGNERPHGDHVEGVEAGDPLLHLHIFEGIEKDRRVQENRDREKAAGDRVHPKSKVHALRKASGSHRRPAHCCRHCRKIREDRAACTEYFPYTVVRRNQRNRDSREGRYQYCRDYDHNSLLSGAPHANMPNPCPISCANTQLKSPMARFAAVSAIMGRL